MITAQYAPSVDNRNGSIHTLQTIKRIKNEIKCFCVSITETTSSGAVLVYLREKRKAAADEILKAGGIFVGHCHIETKNQTDQEIINEAVRCEEYIREKFVQ
jgi:hypothetical protein